MGANEIQSLNIFGEKFEIKFFNQLIGRRLMKGKELYRDIEYGVSMIDILKATHFSLSSSKILLEIIKEYYVEYRSIPFYDTIREIYSSKYGTEKEIFFQFLNDIEHVVIENADHIKDNARTFIQQQNFTHVVETVKNEWKKGKIKTGDEAIEKVRKAVEVSNSNTRPLVITNESFKLVDNTSRVPIPTGLGKSFDDAISGGPSRGDLILMGAGTGVGKTTFSAIVATKAFLEGKTVFYAFFEGTQNDLFSKLQANWSGFTINEALNVRNKDVIETHCRGVLSKGEAAGGKLIIKKFDAIDTKWSNIEQAMFHIEKVQGYKLDLIIIDYLECIKGDKADYGEKDYMAGPEVLRKIENSISAEKFNCAAWVLLQGGKNTGGIKDLEPRMLSGSGDLQKITHVMITIGKDEIQMSEKKANINIWKNRLGEGRVKFEDVKFDNSRVKILVEDFNITSAFEKNAKQ